MRLEVRRERRGPAVLAALSGVVLALVVVMFALGRTPLPAALFISVPQVGIVVWCLRIALRKGPDLVLDERGVEDVRAGRRLGWDEVASVRARHARGDSRELRLVVESAAPGAAAIEYDLYRAATPAGEVIEHAERLWGAEIPRTSPGADPAPLPAITAVPSGPLEVYDRRRYWVQSAIWSGLMLAAVPVLFGTGEYPVSAASVGLVALVAATPAWLLYQSVRFALRRKPAYVVDHEGIRDTREPIAIRWSEVTRIQYVHFIESHVEHHDLLVHLHDHNAFVQRWTAAWQPGMTKKPPEHPIRRALGIPLTERPEAIMARIEYEWGWDIERPLPEPAAGMPPITELEVRARVLALEDRDDALAAGRADGDQAPA